MHVDSLLRRESQWRRRADSNRRIEVLQTSALVHLATAPHLTGRRSRNPRGLSGSGLRQAAYGDRESAGAEGETRTPTALRPQRPQRCASTNSATSARFATHSSEPHSGRLRANSVVATREIIATRPRRPQIRSHQDPGSRLGHTHVQPAAGAFLTDADGPHKLAAPQRTGVRGPP